MALIYHMNGPNRTKNDPSMVENRPMPYAEKDPLWKDTAFTSTSLIYFSATDFLVSYIFLPTALAQKGIYIITGHNCRPRQFLLLGVVRMLVWKWNFHAFVGNTVTATLQSQRLGIHQQNRVGCFFLYYLFLNRCFPPKTRPAFLPGKMFWLGRKKTCFFPSNLTLQQRHGFRLQTGTRKKTFRFFGLSLLFRPLFFFKRRRRWGLLKP